MITDDQLEQLQVFADMEGTEVGEAVQLLLNLHGYSDYVSDEMEKCLEKELLAYYEDFIQNYEIVETEEIYKRTVKSLETR